MDCFFLVYLWSWLHSNGDEKLPVFLSKMNYLGLLRITLNLLNVTWEFTAYSRSFIKYYLRFTDFFIYFLKTH